jgi:chaperonin GroES
MNIKPLGDNVILKPAKKEETTASGIVLPETVDKERPEQGEVIAVGPGKLNSDGKRMEMGVKVGDTILFKKYGPDEIKVDGQDVLVVSEGDIIAILG